MAKSNPNIDMQIIGLKPVGNKGKNRKDLTWREAKHRYRRMKPMGDSDHDGYPNSKDCTPLDPMRDGVWSNVKSAVSKAASAVVSTAKSVVSVPSAVISKAVTTVAPSTSKSTSTGTSTSTSTGTKTSGTGSFGTTTSTKTLGTGGGTYNKSTGTYIDSSGQGFSTAVVPAGATVVGGKTTTEEKLRSTVGTVLGVPMGVISAATSKPTTSDTSKTVRPTLLTAKTGFASGLTSGLRAGAASTPVTLASPTTITSKISETSNKVTDFITKPFRVTSYNLEDYEGKMAQVKAKSDAGTLAYEPAITQAPKSVQMQGELKQDVIMTGVLQQEALKSRLNEMSADAQAELDKTSKDIAGRLQSKINAGSIDIGTAEAKYKEEMEAKQREVEAKLTESANKDIAATEKYVKDYGERRYTEMVPKIEQQQMMDVKTNELEKVPMIVSSLAKGAQYAIPYAGVAIAASDITTAVKNKELQKEISFLKVGGKEAWKAEAYNLPLTVGAMWLGGKAVSTPIKAYKTSRDIAGAKTNFFSTEVMTPEYSKINTISKTTIGKEKFYGFTKQGVIDLKTKNTPLTLTKTFEDTTGSLAPNNVIKFTGDINIGQKIKGNLRAGATRGLIIKGNEKLTPADFISERVQPYRDVFLAKTVGKAYRVKSELVPSNKPALDWDVIQIKKDIGKGVIAAGRIKTTKGEWIGMRSAGAFKPISEEGNLFKFRGGDKLYTKPGSKSLFFKENIKGTVKVIREGGDDFESGGAGQNLFIQFGKQKELTPQTMKAVSQEIFSQRAAAIEQFNGGQKSPTPIFGPGASVPMADISMVSPLKSSSAFAAPIAKETNFFGKPALEPIIKPKPSRGGSTFLEPTLNTQQVTRQVIEPITLSKSKIRLQQGLLFDSRLESSSRNINRLQLLPRQSLKLNQALVPVQRMKQLTRQQQRLTTLNRTSGFKANYAMPKFDFKFKPFIAGTKTAYKAPRRAAISQPRPSYAVFSKRYGKEMKIFSGAPTKRAALDIGAAKTLKTLGASFWIKPSKERAVAVKTRGEYGANIFRFRPSKTKAGVIVQKAKGVPGGRLAFAGERAEIKAAKKSSKIGRRSKWL